jgi:SAM-dependent methyltransferase/uncharacterized protein YbaR (Trm112 family)
MRDDLLEILSCPARTGDQASGRCAGGLVKRDEITLVCSECGSEYPIHRGVPRLLAPHSPTSSYMEDSLIQAYYEMHFGPFLVGPGLTQRRSFPQPGLDREGPAPKNFDDLRNAGSLRHNESSDFYGCINQLAAWPALTEEFYQVILELCQPFLQPEGVVIDIGCGLGRMVAELSARGATRVIGIDLSARMVEEAATLLASRQPVPVRLNLVGERTINATLELPFQRDYDFLAGDATWLPLVDGKIDLALCLNLVDRVKEPRKVVAECWRILRPGGKLLISDPYDWEGENWRAIDGQLADMGQWFAGSAWRRMKEIDGIPFVLRRSSRRIIVYLNHCILYEKIDA